MDKGENAEWPGPLGLGMERAALGPWEQALGTSTFSFGLALQLQGAVAQDGDQEVAGECGATPPVEGRVRPPL